ncbi:MAG: YHS domain-containing protein [Verrucomicrobiota bacterium]|jgi:YHS domain-containing protein
MKTRKPLLVAVLFVALCAAASTAVAGDTNTVKLKPYTLKTCVVSGDKLGEMGEPFVYAYKGREIKFCCKGCLKDFNKDPAKYLKMIDEAEAKAKKAKS